jgi:hypothetical protein
MGHSSFRIGAARFTYRVVLVRAWKILRKICAIFGLFLCGCVSVSWWEIQGASAAQ